MQRLKLFIPLIFFIILFVLVLGSLITNKSQDVPSALLDKPVPPFDLPELNTQVNSSGDEPVKTITTESLLGQPFLLNAWATWCQPCLIEHPTIVELSEQGINIVGLNYKDEEDAAKRWLVDLKNPYLKVIFDKEGRLGLDLGVSGIPETYFVDAQGVIRYKHVGIINEKVWLEKLRPVWQKIALGSSVK